MKKFKYILILLLFIVNVNSVYGLSRINLLTGKEIPIYSEITNGIDVTINNEIKKLAKAKSSFNCEEPNLKISAEILEDLNEMFQTFGTDIETASRKIIKEMAAQYGIEFAMEMLARMHYTQTSDLAKGENSLKALKLMTVAKCVSTGVAESIEGELEGGIGTNIYDLLSGKIGFNFVSLAGIYPCIKKAMGEPKDKAAKEALEKSRKWVRHFLYKLLNESFADMFNLQLSAGELDPKCGELANKINKNNFQISLGQFGNIMTPMGTEIQSLIEVKEPTKVGEKNPEPIKPIAEDIKKEDADTKAAQQNGTETPLEAKEKTLETKLIDIANDNSLTDEEKQEAQKTTFLKGKLANNGIYETPIVTTLIQKPNYEIIDSTDLSPNEIISFNTNIYNKIVYSLERENTNLSKSIESNFLQLLKKILTLTKIDVSKIKEQEKMFLQKDPKTNQYIYTLTTPEEKIIQSGFYGDLIKKIQEYRKLRSGILTKNDQTKILLQTANSAPNSNMGLDKVSELSIVNKAITRLNTFNEVKAYMASGEFVLYDKNSLAEEQIKTTKKLVEIVYNQYKADLTEFRDAITNNQPLPKKFTTESIFLNSTYQKQNWINQKINNPQNWEGDIPINFNNVYQQTGGAVNSIEINENIILKRPLHELEYLRTLYEAESRPYLKQLLGALPGQAIGNTTISSQSADMTKVPNALIDYAIKKIKLVKQLYAIELLDTYAKRSAALKRWVMEKYQTDKKINQSIQDFMEIEMEKATYKLMQKRFMIKLFLEKDVK